MPTNALCRIASSGIHSSIMSSTQASSGIGVSGIGCGQLVAHSIRSRGFRERGRETADVAVVRRTGPRPVVRRRKLQQGVRSTNFSSTRNAGLTDRHRLHELADVIDHERAGKALQQASRSGSLRPSSCN